MMANQITGQSKCDDGHIFDNKDVELKPFGTGIEITPPLGMSIRFVSKDGRIMAGKPGAEDKILHCPVCHKPHLFGFDAAK